MTDIYVTYSVLFLTCVTYSVPCRIEQEEHAQAISEHLISQNFQGEHAPRPP